MSSDSKLNLLGCRHASDQTAEHGLECPAVRNFHLNFTEMFFKLLKSIKYLFTLYTLKSLCIIILHTVLYTFPKVLTRRICLPIKSFFCWASFP